MVRALASAALSCLVLLAPGPAVGARPVAGSEAASLAERSLARRPASRRALEEAVAALVRLHPLAIDELAGAPGEPGIAALYNRVLGRVVVALEARLGGRQEGEPLVLAAGGSRVELRWAAGEPGLPWRPRSHRLVPAGDFGSSFATRAAGDGFGAAVVALRRGTVPRVVRPAGGWFPSFSYFYPLTVVAEVTESPDGSATVELRLVDPRLADQVVVAGRRLPLAFDLSAQIEAAIDEAKVGSRGVKGMRRAERLLPELGLFLPEPFRPEKVPVVFVHGLLSTPATWFEAYNALIADPRIRETYQFWFFNYPSGLPFSYSAQLLRDSLRRTVADLDPESANPNLSRMILVGHSMGGLLSRLQVTASGDRLWRSIFTRPFEELEITGRDAALLRPIYFFEPQPFVARVIFVATPHRGSSLASGLVGKLGAALVALPRELTRIAKRVIAANRALLAAGASVRPRAPDSIETLSPVDPFLVALDPLAPAVPFHSIFGDRGAGNGPASSDGVVPYRSAWLPGAESELVVAAGHNAHEHPAAIAEIRRILLLHAGR